MEEGETEAIPTRKELRKQKLMEYLTTKGKLKQPSLRSNLRNDCNVKKSVASTLKVVAGKENKTPAVRCSYESKKAPTLAAGLLIPPGRKVFEVNKKVGVKDNILNKQKNTHSLSATNGTAQPRPNPLLTRVHTIKSSKDNQNTASHVKKLANTGIQSSGKTSSNTAHAAVTNSDSRFRSSSNPSWSCPMKTASVRMSLGPLVKTKTGLIPAVTQPRNSQNLTQTSATTGGTSTARSFAGQSSMSSFAQRKTTHAASRNNSVIKRTTASLTTRATIEVQDPNKNKSKILLGKHFQPPCKSQLSSRLKSNSSKCITEPIKSEERVGMSKPTKSYGQSTHRSTKPRSEGERQKNATLQISSGPVNRCTSRVVSKIGRGVVAEQVGKTKTCKETNSKRGHSSANATQPQTGVRRPGAPVMSQTVPLPTRTISHTGQATNFKMTKAPVRVIPQTEGKKMTAAQEERMRKLQEWREAKGISYKRPPMPVKPQARRTVALPGPFWATMKDEDEAHSLICAVDRSLADCLKLLGEGCPPDQVKEVLSRLPTVSHKFAKYWICQARLMEQEGNLDVLPMFEEAVRVVLEPVDELRTVVFEILKKKDETQASDENGKEGDQVPAGENTPEGINNPVMTPKPVRALIWGEKGDSSVVKYKITATPGGPSSQQKEPTRVNGQEVRFFTPVRRSVRIKRASLHYPASLQDHDLCVASYNDLISEEDKERSEKQEDSESNPSADETILYIYRENEALKDKVCVQLVCDDEGI